MRIANIIANDVVNGEGVCVSLFVQGCNKHCFGCFNPESWDLNGGIEINDQELINYIIDLLHKNNISRNLSILGGEPFLWTPFIAELINQVKSVYPKTKIWIWTGYTYEEILSIKDLKEKNYIDFILHNIDVLIDGPFIQSELDRSLPYRGSRNQRILKLT